jgi:hypothetical protein
MRTLRDLKNEILEIEETYPEWMDLPIIYSNDDEGNCYQKVYSNVCPTQVHDVKQWQLEVVGFFDDTNPNDNERDISQHDVNCICIN